LGSRGGHSLGELRRERNGKVPASRKVSFFLGNTHHFCFQVVYEGVGIALKGFGGRASAVLSGDGKRRARNSERRDVDGLENDRIDGIGAELFRRVPSSDEPERQNEASNEDSGRACHTGANAWNPFPPREAKVELRQLLVDATGARLGVGLAESGDELTFPDGVRVVGDGPPTLVPVAALDTCEPHGRVKCERVRCEIKTRGAGCRAAERD
jgi:hypothetical protein